MDIWLVSWPRGALSHQRGIVSRAHPPGGQFDFHRGCVPWASGHSEAHTGAGTIPAQLPGRAETPTQVTSPPEGGRGVTVRGTEGPRLAGREGRAGCAALDGRVPLRVAGCVCVRLSARVMPGVVAHPCWSRPERCGCRGGPAAVTSRQNPEAQLVLGTRRPHVAVGTWGPSSGAPALRLHLGPSPLGSVACSLPDLSLVSFSKPLSGAWALWLSTVLRSFSPTLHHVVLWLYFLGDFFSLVPRSSVLPSGLYSYGSFPPARCCGAWAASRWRSVLTSEKFPDPVSSPLLFSDRFSGSVLDLVSLPQPGDCGRCSGSRAHPPGWRCVPGRPSCWRQRRCCPGPCHLPGFLCILWVPALS